MNRAEYIEQCKLLTEDELAAKAGELRERSNSRTAVSNSPTTAFW